MGMDDSQDRLTALFRSYSGRIYAYARRSLDPTGAEEVVADTFLAAWRKLDLVPVDALPWLLVAARYEVLRHRRSASRQNDLVATLGQVLAAKPATSDVQAAVEARDSGLRALASLSETDRDALLLVAWDGLSLEQAAAVQGCRLATFQVRLHRARRRFAAAAGDSEHSPVATGHEVTA
jgi:RNA polymerase sigma factor (sigma-70 family)